MFKISHAKWAVPLLLAVAAALVAPQTAQAKAYPAPPMPHLGPHLGPACCPPVCLPPKTLTLHVQNPACCTDCRCVTVCVPACCEGPPKVCSRCGILGRGIVTYEWCCGHRVTVVFTARGGLRVR